MKAAAVGLSGVDSQDPLKLPRFVWTNLVFQVPQRQIQSKVTTRKTRRQERNLAAVSKQGLRSEGCIPRRKNGERKLLPLWTSCSEEDETEDGRASTLPGSPAVNPPLLPAPKSLDTSEKQPPRKILVDLRPLLENVMDPVDSWREKPLEKDPPKERCPSSNSGDSRDESLFGGGGDDQATEMPAEFSKDCGIPRVHLFLPPIRASKLYRKSIKTSRRTIWTSPVESTQLRKTTFPAIRTFQPQLQMPVLLPKTDLQKHVPFEAERSTGPEGGPEAAAWGLPAASSPDFQLPTQLLLQKLQETTTSNNHLLITQVLRSLREELLGGSPRESDHRENQKDFLELPRIQPWKPGKADKREKASDAGMEATKNRLIRLIGNHNNFPQGTGVVQVPPGPFHEKNPAGLDRRPVLSRAWHPTETHQKSWKTITSTQLLL
ncbi:uncharacterized protein LOC112541035 isoform X2 [Python bivittatus]|nr:uncharacterized protein LOC112541035 isoform X2 [Python bivittatus]